MITTTHSYIVYYGSVLHVGQSSTKLLVHKMWLPSQPTQHYGAFTFTLEHLI